MVIDLWPEDIGHVDVKPPVAIVREQASLLGTKTQQVLEAKVESLDAPEPYHFGYRFYLLAPGLGYYRYDLFRIRHGIDLYPVRFYVDESIQGDLGFDNDSSFWEVGSEEELIDRLRDILGAPRTMRIIKSLLAQAQYGLEEGEDEIPF